MFAKSFTVFDSTLTRAKGAVCFHGGQLTLTLRSLAACVWETSKLRCRVRKQIGDSTTLSVSLPLTLPFGGFSVFPPSVGGWCVFDYLLKRTDSLFYNRCGLHCSQYPALKQGNEALISGQDLISNTGSVLVCTHKEVRGQITEPQKPLGCALHRVFYNQFGESM